MRLPNGFQSIESLIKGQKVSSRHDGNYQDHSQAITSTFNRTADHYYRLVTEKNEIFNVTSEHPIWLQGKGWTQAKDIKRADPIATQTGDILVLQNTRINQPLKVYNFSVANTPNYFVGTQGIWVHNAGGECDIYGGGVGGVSREVADLAEANITNSGKTILGHFPEYIDKAKERGDSYFDIGDAWNTLSDAERWAANRHFLDKIADSGDQVLLSLPKNQIRDGSYLTKEIEYLMNEKGYRWINQWTLEK